MVIILKQNAKKEEISELLQWIKAQNVDPQSIEGESQHILGLVGNTQAIDIDAITGGFNLQSAWTTAKICADTINAKAENLSA